MRRLVVTSLAFFLTLSMLATAQSRGMTGTQGHSIHIGPAASIVPAGTPPGIHIGTTISPPFGFGNRNFTFHHHHFPRTFGNVYPYVPYYYGGAYYGWDNGYNDDYPYTGYIPGTFDKYPGYPYPAQYAPPPYYSSLPPQVNNTPEPQPPQRQRSNQRSNDEFSEPTVLVFRDGHREEIANYAIMGSTIFVLAGSHSRIPIAELDVPATERVNQDHGVDFHVPTKAR